MLLNFIVSLALFVATTCSASIITFFGENSDNADRWRTADVPKTINPAGNNIYGNDGYVMFGTTSTASTATIRTSGIDPFSFRSTASGSDWITLNTRLNVPPSPSYVSTIGVVAGSGFNGMQTASGFEAMDNPAPAGGFMKSGFAFAPGANVFKDLFTFSVNGSVPSTFTLGLFFNNSTVVEVGGLSQARITDSAGGTATGLRTEFGNIDALFFNISGATAGDLFTVAGLTLSPSNLEDVSGITFDTTIPEPTTLGGCAVAVLVFLWLGRSNKNPKQRRPV